MMSPVHSFGASEPVDPSESVPPVLDGTPTARPLAPTDAGAEVVEVVPVTWPKQLEADSTPLTLTVNGNRKSVSDSAQYSWEALLVLKTVCPEL